MGEFSIAWQVMKWPLVACLILPPLLVYMGLHVVKREVIFVDLALAQVASLGTCVALLLGYDFHDRVAFWIALGLTFAAAALFSWARTSVRRGVPQEAMIGITFVIAAAASILLLSRVTGGKEELEHLLTGDILNVTLRDVGSRALTFVAVAAFYGAFHRRFALISESHGEAVVQGMRVPLWDFFFYAAFAIVVVSFVRVAGVLLTFTYLIVPAVCALMLAQSWLRRLVIGWIIAAVSSLGGLFASYQFDLPTGAAIVCAAGLALVLVNIYAVLRVHPAV